jgi:hypothetical protein
MKLEASMTGKGRRVVNSASAGRMRLLTMFGLIVAGIFSVSGATMAVPNMNEVVRFEREHPVFQSKVIPRERGDRLLTVLRRSGRRLCRNTMRGRVPM